MSLEPIDLSPLPPDDQQRQVRESIREFARRPFAISEGPHWRAALVKLQDEEHVLIVVQHHIISDGWSLGVFVRELGELYDAFASGHPSPLGPLEIQYADYAHWQRQWLQGEMLREQLAFWKRHLHGELPMLNLATDQPRPRLQTFSGAVVGIMLPASLGESLRAFSRQEGVTLFMTLLASFAILLHRYSGQADLIVGTSIGNRNHVELESLIGFFVNTLALRMDVSGEPSFREVVSRVRDVALAAFENQETPFERLVEELKPPRDLGRPPIFQVMFTLHNAPTERLKLRNLTLSGLECDIGTSKFELTLNVTDLGHGMAAVMEFNTSLFDRSTIQRMLSHWALLLERAVSDPEKSIGRLPMLSDVEERRVLHEWNHVESDVSLTKTVIDSFVAQARSTPNRVAVEAANGAWSYAEVDRWSDQLAGKLQLLGIRRGDRVGISVGRSLGLVGSVLAVLKAGAAFVPLDVDSPPRRLEYSLVDSQVGLVIADSRSAGKLPASDARVVVLDDGGDREAIHGARRTVGATDAAYLMYTSGSTGQPKAVVVPHGALLRFIEAMQLSPGMGADDVMLAVTPLGFDISILELLVPLTVGARIVIADRETAQDPQRLARMIEEVSPTIMQATPATWKMLVDAGWSGSDRLKVLCGGEALPQDLAQQIRGRCRSLWNMYGPTETTVWSTIQEIMPDDKVVSIGRPIRNTRVYLLDSRLQPVPVGVPGELYIGGDGVARGYFGRPGMTAEKFLPDPFATRPGQRLYRTGDLARYLPSGRIVFLGRMDGQVKLRGLRMELGEIETTMRADPAVANAVALLRDDGLGPRLVGYLVPAHDKRISLDELRSRLREYLPANMIPSEFVVLDSLPLTTAGKVDRRSLPAPLHDRLDRAKHSAPPRNELDGQLVELWKQLLPFSEIGIDDNFFDLGGHSLLLAQLQRLISTSLNHQVSLVQLFQYPTIAAISDFLSGRTARDMVEFGAQQGAARRRAWDEGPQ